MSVFIIGSNGFIGKRLTKDLSRRHDIKLVSSHPQKRDEIHLDLADAGDFNYGSIKKDDFVILLASISSPDVCKKDFDHSYKINVTGTITFAGECLKRQARVIFFSSDTVYGGSGGCFDENSKCDPMGEYAQMKYEVETKFSGDRNFKVFRPSYIFSRDDRFTSYLYDCSRQSKVADVFHLFYRNVVYIEDLVLAVAELLDKWSGRENKVYNICGPDLISRLDIANIYKARVDSGLKIKAVEPPADFFGSRPRKIELKSLYFSKLINKDPVPINEAMDLEFKSERTKPSERSLSVGPRS
jgi:dTDP-4-dehydrorhamnose reductase